MAKEPSRTSIKTRTEDLRREIEAATAVWKRPLRSKNFLLSLLIWTGFVLIVGVAALWTRSQPLVDQKRIMRETRTVHADFELPNEPATDAARKAAISQTPRVYVGMTDILDEVRKSLEGLPGALKDADSIEKVEAGVQKQYALTPEGLAAIKQYIEADGKISQAWMDRVKRLGETLARSPILDAATFQVEQTSTNAQLELRVGEAAPVYVDKSGAPVAGGSGGSAGKSTPISAENPALAEELRKWAEKAGFTGPVLDVVAARLAWQPKPTFAFDKNATLTRQTMAADRVEPKTVKYSKGEVIYRRGDALTSAQLDVFRHAQEQELLAATPLEAWVQRAGVFGLVGAVAAALAGYTVLFVPRVRRNPTRTLAIASLVGITAIAACYATATQPGLIALTAVAPTVFVAVMLCVAYDQRVALAYALLHGVLVCAALQQPIGVYAVMIAGVGMAVWRLKEVRDRDALIKMGIWAGVALACATFVGSILSVPVSREAMMQAAWDAGLAGFSGLLIAGVTLFILPVLEKLFDITTGMTLVELRDPKQPLLRQLQQRAPGTYNHSLNLASLAEAASEAIRANGLLAYVGALYHDIGKMNKPDYFVENQAPGINRHDKLSPAMSLLVIVGHVKDGMELAREFNLPRPLWHFIESHHGTTLVEYFYHRARKKAEQQTRGGEEVEAPSEMEYRYPGPKPRTKEAAIIMLCDAVESAARSLVDPTPSRIDATVRAIATKRLMDGQFDDCDLTLRELNIIVETVSKTLASIYHGRIAYPSLPAPGANSPGRESGPASTFMPAPSAGSGTQMFIPPRNGNGANGAHAAHAGNGSGGGPGEVRPAGIGALVNPVRVTEKG